MIESVKKHSPTPLAQPETDLSRDDFESVFARYWEHVYRVLHRLVADPAEAEDLALETFVRLYQRLPIEEPDFQLGGWLYRVATNLGLRSIRSFKRREQYELAAGKSAIDETQAANPVDIFSQKEEYSLARQALAQMNDRQSQILVLRYSGLSYKEIALTLELSPASIGPLLLRAEREFEARYRALTPEEA
jgi:RNA polymerase sigma-70 factor (ECF subfamily)